MPDSRRGVKVIRSVGSGIRKEFAYSTEEFIEDNKIGLRCGSNNSEGIIRNIRRMVEQEEFRESCGKNARKYLLENATADIVCDIILKNLREYECGN